MTCLRVLISPAAVLNNVGLARYTCPIIVHPSTCHSCSNSLTATWLASVLFKSCLQSQGHTFETCGDWPATKLGQAINQSH